MSKEITQAKKLMVARLYFEGLSYDEIARKTGIAKGSVAALGAWVTTRQQDSYLGV